MAQFVNAIIISDLVPNVPEFEALAVSDGKNVLLTFRQPSGENIRGSTIDAVELTSETIERLLNLIADPS